MAHRNIVERDYSLDELFGDVITDEAREVIAQIHRETFDIQAEAISTFYADAHVEGKVCSQVTQETAPGVVFSPASKARSNIDVPVRGTLERIAKYQSAMYIASKGLQSGSYAPITKSLAASGLSQRAKNSHGHSNKPVAAAASAKKKNHK
ncbi:TPA: hypothetical protein SB604_000884 [Yersinia enterocolitica]|nr:hypothetical protein [Yersinia enterocolitica]